MRPADFQLEPDPTIQPAQIVILVDESGSISDDDLRRERNAAAMIALGEFSPGSSVAVIGFGSDNGQSGQTPVDVVCPPVTVSAAQDQQALADCVGKLHKRTQSEGNGTDHAAALQQALSYLTQPAGSGPKMVFLLTDGKLDVSDSPRYGPDNVGDQRNRAALELVDTTLAKATEARVQVWPLGFGKVDRAQLDRFAAGGFQGSCGPKATKPFATVASDSSMVAQALLTAFSAARCAGIGKIQRTPLAGGTTQQVTVEIPPIATDGSIIVVKQDPRIVVTFIDPDGATAPKSGSSNDSTFQGSGTNGPVEALRIVNPKPGKWQVRLASFPEVPPVEVSAVVTWQGAVRAVMSVDPPSPRTGQEVVVSLRLQTRKRAISDPEELAGLSFDAQLSGAGFATMPVPLADEGSAPDESAHDGVFTGRITVPGEAAGSIKFTGSVTGIGISGDTRVVEARISTGRPALTALISIGSGTVVAPGESLSGTITLTSSQGHASRIRLLVTDLGPGTIASIAGSNTVFDVPPTGTRSYPFRVSFAPDSARGTNSLTLRVVDDADPTVEIGSKPVAISVRVPEKPPPWLQIIAGVVGLAGAVAGWLAYRAWRRRRDVRGLAVFLYEGSRPRGDLAAPEQPSSRFRFAVQRDGYDLPVLVEGSAESPAETYELSRVGGAVLLRTPYGERRALHVGETTDLGENLTIEVRDERASADQADQLALEPGSWSGTGQAESDRLL